MACFDLEKAYDKESLQKLLKIYDVNIKFLDAVKIFYNVNREYLENEWE